MKYKKLLSLKNYFRSKKPAPSGLVIEFGNRGSGKSTDIAKDSLIFEKNKNSVYDFFYTNIQINTNDERIKYLDLVNYKLTDYIEINEKTKKGNCYTIPSVETPFKIKGNCIIEIDELGIVAHSRDYKNFPKEFIHLVKYLRKLGILLKANSQSFDIDKTLREGASDLRLKRKIGFWSISRKINKKIICEKPSKEYHVKAEEQIHDELSFAPMFSKDWLHVTFIPFYTDRFDSFS